MSSLSDIQQIHGMLQEISRLLDEVDTKTDTVTRKTGTSTDSLRKLETVALRYLAITRRMGLPEDAEAFIQLITRMIVALRMLDITLKMVQADMGPVGWATLIASGIYTGLAFYDIGSPAY